MSTKERCITEIAEKKGRAAAQDQGGPVGYLWENHHYFHLNDTAGQELDFHFHDFDKIVILRSGCVDYTVENTSYALAPGSILLVRHHAIHKAVIDKSEPYDRIIIYLSHGFFESVLPAEKLTYCFSVSDRNEECLLIPGRKNLQELDGILNAYENTIGDDRYGAEAFRDTLIMQLLIVLNRTVREEKTSLADTQLRYDKKIKRTLDYIDSHIAEELSVDDLAERVFLSRYHFMRLFKAQTGSTVHAYVRQKRLLHAARLIREGTAAGVAARESGFDDYSTFCRAFRECFGIKPSDIMNTE